jgi:hypothetical protein
MGYMDPQNPIGVPRSRHEGRLSGVGTLGKSQLLQNQMPSKRLILP